MSNRTFLLEIGLEEMPARFVTDAMNQLKEKMTAWLKENRLSYEAVRSFSTPRRLAVLVEGLEEKQEDRSEEAKGPSKKIARDNEGNWSKAAQGFARGQKVAVDDLYFKEVKGEEYVFVDKYIKGKSTIELLARVDQLLTGITFAKNMRWGNGKLRYVRPIKWLAALYGNEIIDFNIAGVQSSNVTTGHRFLGETVVIEEASEYTRTLLKEHVLADPAERKSAIVKQIDQLAETEGWDVPVDEDLLEEVNNLVEYPTVFFGTFDESFLHVPDDVLITSMKEHQRYFPVLNKEGELLPNFITVRNGDHRHLENVQKGNEKVLRARLADAEFFYKEDLKLNIDDAANRLENVVYHEELGSIGDKVRRIKDLSSRFAKRLNFDQEAVGTVERAAHLSKFDLVTHMVDEFPELEGRMGEEYAEKAGEKPEVAAAIREHYLPRHAKDTLPQRSESAVLSVADKLDTVVTSFGIGQIPTGSQDPHGLRRQTAAVISILLDQKWDIKVTDLFDEALALSEQRGVLKRSKEDVKADLMEFTVLRIKNMLQDKNVRYDIIEAVLSAGISRVDTIVEKGRFLTEQAKKQDFKHLVEAFSRVTNISKKAEGNVIRADESLFKQPEENQLYATLREVKQQVVKARSNADIESEFEALKQLEPAIHTYFDNIMVMTDDAKVKQNRLAQMKEASDVILAFADFQAIVFHSE
ncbi:glycine--tRNA ligase subunit beta [Alteribacter keqinensis]|uniref:Glycine--tRNA ligase beta subunit n=1 Tax=Alteribacter keqinensis TaxID=2483800 RepID=A0A3M7TTN4_9BACI|nr:glycine--tRNA ligase subunit beta [Alteribacter keqinensis]RNA68877.1 glycine--tRNA ligase subunit beta [Alteribacter keqinensis]